MKNYTKLFVALLIVCSLLVSSCATEVSTSTSNSGTTTSGSSIELEPIKLGVMAPLTGEAASWGENALAGVTLATEEINAKGGINGRMVELYVEDDQCGSAGVTAIQTLINIDNVDGIVGPVCSSSAGPALPVAASDGAPLVLIGASAPDLTSYGDNIFRVYPSDALQGVEAAKYMVEEEGLEKIAIIYVKNDWGEGIYNVFKEEAESLGAEIVYTSGALQDDVDFKTEVTKLESMEIDAIYLPLYPNGNIAFFKQMEEQGVEIPIYGGDSLSGEEVVTSGYGDGAMYILPKSGELTDSFEAKVHAIDEFSDLDLTFVAGLGYDSAVAMFEAMENAHSISDSAIVSELWDVNIPGVFSETISFDEVGDLISSDYEWFMIQDGESVSVR